MPRSQVVLSVVGGLVGLVFAVLLFRSFGPDTSASSQLFGFEVLSDRSVRVDVQVARSPGEEVFCVVRARDRAGSEVGRAEFDVPPSQARTVRVSEVVETSSLPVTGELVGCTRGSVADGPAS